MLAIKNNIMAGNAARHLGKAYDSLAKSVERLASGLRINSAKDDAAGLAVRELIRADVAVLQQGSRNAQDGISLLQTMEGAMAVMDENLIRMKELAEQAATGSYSSAQRSIMNAEFQEMASEIDRIAGATAFNDITMLNIGTGTVTIHVGTTDTISIDKVNMTTASDGLNIATGTAGTAITSKSSAGVTAASNNWLTMQSGTDSGTYTLTIQFAAGTTSEDALAITLTAAAATTPATYSLQTIVDLINVVSQNLGNDADGVSKNHQAAEAYYDTDSTKYVLKLSSRLSTASSIALTVAAGTNLGANMTLTGGWTTESGTGVEGNGFQSEDTSASGISITTEANAILSLTRLTSAITEKDENRATFGYKMNRLESTVTILDIQAENLMAAESRISDVDVATEMATLTRTQVLSQAGIAMLAQANAMPQMALTLLR